LEKAGIILPDSEVVWSPDLRVAHVRVGDVARAFAASAVA
jgi:N-acetylglucosamine-6-phosphate deacetylase